MIYNTAQAFYENIFKTFFQDYLSDLQSEQSKQNKAFGVNCNIIDVSEIKKAFKEELFIYLIMNFSNIFFALY